VYLNGSRTTVERLMYIFNQNGLPEAAGIRQQLTLEIYYLLDYFL